MQSNSRNSSKGYKTSSPSLRKHKSVKQTNMTSSILPEQKLSDTFYEDDEETALLGKIIFNLELDQQEELGNEGGYNDKRNTICGNIHQFYHHYITLRENFIPIII